MTKILIATNEGCRVFSENGETAWELAGRAVSFITKDVGDSCLAILDENQIWRRDAGAAWSFVAQAQIPLQSLTASGDAIFAGGLNEATMLRVSAAGDIERLNAFDMACVGHIQHGMWTHPRDRSADYNSLEHWVSLARLVERGLFDGLFLADILGVYDVLEGTPGPSLRSSSRSAAG